VTPQAGQTAKALAPAAAAFVAVGAGLAAAGLLPLETRAVAAIAFLVAAVATLAGWRRSGARFGLASRVTLLRLALIAWIAGLAAATWQPGVGWWAAGLGLVALVLDGVDGWLARRRGEVSPFGARLDMEADAAAILVLAAAALAWGRAGPWVLLAGGLRYAFVAAGWAWPRLARPLPPRPRRRLAMVVCYAALALALAPPFAGPAAAGLAAFAVLAVAYSFAVDVVWLIRRPEGGEE